MQWTLRVSCRSFYIGDTYAHLEIHHDGALPGVTLTGYRSIFCPMATFAETTPENYIRSLLTDLPQTQQLTLF